MARFLMRIMLSAPAMALINILVVVPLALSIVSVGQDLWDADGLSHVLDVAHELEIVEGIGIIVIGWGFIVEERGSLREMFRLGAPADKERQVAIDTICQSSGVGLLIFGVFSEFAVEAVRLPNNIIFTQGFDDVVIWIGLGFLALCVYVFLHNIVSLIRAEWLGYRPPEHVGEPD